MSEIPEPYLITSIKDNYPSASYYASSKSMVKKVNGWLNLSDPITVYPKIYEERYDEIIGLMIQNLVIKSHGDLSSKVATLHAAMRFAGYHTGTFHTHRSQLKSIPIEIKPRNKEFIPWEELHEKLLKTSKTCSSPSGRNIASAYAHGYVLRVGEIFQSCTINHPDYNFLDIPGKKWYIRAGCTKNNKDRDFPVSDEFIDSLNISKKGFLVYKGSGRPYKKSCFVLKTVGLDDLPSVSEIRSSYETWNHCEMEGTESDKAHNSLILGHSVQTAVEHYTPNKIAIKIMEKKIVDKILPSKKIKVVVKLRIKL